MAAGTGGKCVLEGETCRLEDGGRVPERLGDVDGGARTHRPRHPLGDKAQGLECGVDIGAQCQVAPQDVHGVSDRQHPLDLGLRRGSRVALSDAPG